MKTLKNVIIFENLKEISKEPWAKLRLTSRMSFCIRKQIT